MITDFPRRDRPPARGRRRLFLGACLVAAYLFLESSAGAVQNAATGCPHAGGGVSRGSGRGTLPDTGGGEPPGLLLTATGLLAGGLVLHAAGRRRAGGGGADGVHGADGAEP